MNRSSALALMHEYTASLSLRRHMLAVEAAMRAMARKFGEDEEKWGLVGLLHDFDYERWPDPPDHPLQGAAILTERGYPADVIYAIKSHADYLPDCPRVSRLDKALYACDELTGFITACAMVRPELFAVLFLALTLWAIRRFEGGRIGLLLPFPLLVALWTNVHPSALAGIAS